MTKKAIRASKSERMKGVFLSAGYLQRILNGTVINAPDPRWLGGPISWPGLGIFHAAITTFFCFCSSGLFHELACSPFQAFHPRLLHSDPLIMSKAAGRAQLEPTERGTTKKSQRGGNIFFFKRSL